MSFLINSKKPLKIFVEENNYSSISLAVTSFTNDLTKLFKKPILVSDKSSADIEIGFFPSDNKEEYYIEITKKKIRLLGSDDLGAIYAIYTFLERELNVPPMYKIEGLKLNKIKEISLKNKKYSSFPTSRFRGWFINDEDLLGSFHSLYKRDVPDYPFYHDVINPKMMDIIAETALRYRMNTIIPSTLINIFHEHERELVEICSERGLYISQHHIEPLGVSKYGFQEFARENHLDETFSFLDNHQAMKECWIRYVKEWSKFPRVIFQVGLRGGGDRPFWINNQEITSDEERGKIISSSINEQYEIIKEYYPYPIYATSTLWMEGAELYKKGLINISHAIILVLSDVGMSQLFGDDFFTIERDKNTNYGIYYHAGYCHTGPHLAEATYPEKIKYCYDLAKEKNNLFYVMTNVANVKELTFNIYVNSLLSFNSSISLKQIYERYAKLYFLDKKDQKSYISAIERYFHSLKDVGEEYYDYFCHKYNFSYHKYENLPFPVVSLNDGMYKAIVYCFYYEEREKIRKPILLSTASDGNKEMKKVLLLFKKLEENLPQNYLVGFREHWTYQVDFYIHYLESAKNFYLACQEASLKNYKKAKILYQKSSDEMKEIISLRNHYFVGEYRDWFKNDKKIDIKFLVKRILDDLKRAEEVQQ